MVILPADVQMPVWRGLLTVPVRVAIDPAGRHPPQAESAEDDEEQAAEDFPAALDDERQRPAERDQGAGAKRQEQRVTDREANGDAERACPLQRWRLARIADRQRCNRHQMISAEPVKEAQGEGG
jgi:hypothetical protein